nr:MAG TPA: hypothetical protein [Caudoviricetes sp.]
MGREPAEKAQREPVLQDLQGGRKDTCKKHNRQRKPLQYRLQGGRCFYSYLKE